MSRRPSPIVQQLVSRYDPSVFELGRPSARLRLAGAGPEPVDVQLDGGAPRITAAGREKLREAGFAPPAPRAAGTTTLVQLQSKAFRCPYCGSTETKLENIFGPTPCRSIRWCESCRQPFEQFKTI